MYSPHRALILILSDFWVRKLQPKREPLASQFLHTGGLNIISEAAQKVSNLISQKKRDLGWACECKCRRTSAYWTCPCTSWALRAFLSSGSRNNATHSWKLHNICIKKSGHVWWRLREVQICEKKIVKTFLSFLSAPSIESYQFRVV